MVTAAWIILFLVIVSILGYKRASLPVWTISLFIYLLLVSRFSGLGWLGLTILWIIFLVIAIPLNVIPLRRWLISKHVLALYRKIKPKMSSTEKEALEVGTVGWDREVFSGMPDWNKLLAYPAPKLSDEELDFLNGPVEQLCRMVDNWDVVHNRFNLPPAVWDFMKEHGFFSIIIPKKYGGKEFSALGHSAIITKISSRSITAATVVGVPNSLGPAELLLEYGTEEQKSHYLPRLARGEEIPCFALTGPEAGSDASAMPDNGIVCKGEFEGKEILGIRLNWDKRYITLAPVATLLGLAFKLYDPDHLLGNKTKLGITCALIPTKTPGITIGRRHFPVNCAFPNGPTQGKDVFIPIDWIIGGPKMAGKGWYMLVERLSVGRAISLPSTVMGGAKISAFTTGAYARIRKQFNLPIGRFGGVEEALARIAGYVYMMDAIRIFTVSAIDRGERPAVPSAISKYHTTELARKVVNEAMDVMGGKGICMGPRNFIAQFYEEMPIGITVEGANILTRCMIIFGQGAIRCHPYILDELVASQDPDEKQALIKFDKALFGHAGFFVSNRIRAFLLSISNGYLAGVPVRDGTQRYFQQLTRFSAAFALVADMAVLTLGAELKRQEKLSGRLGDALSMLYWGSAVLKHFKDQGSPADDLSIVKWACQTILYKIQTALDGVLKNLPNRFVAGLLRIVIFPFGRNIAEPSDKLGHKLAGLLLSPTDSRQRLANGAYLTPDENNPVGLIDVALKKVIAAEDLEKRLRTAERDGQISGMTIQEKVSAAVAANILSAEEAAILLVADEARKEVIAVDSFAPKELEMRHVKRR